MSFLNAGREQARFILNRVKGKPEEGLQALLAARRLNSSISETDLQYGPGKKRQLKTSYYAPICTDNGTCNPNFCDPGVVVEPMQDIQSINRCTASAVYQLNRDDIRLVDGEYNFSEHAKQIIAAALPTVRGKLAAEAMAVLYANAGVTPEGNATRNLPMVDKTNGAVNPMGMWEIERAYRDTGYSDPFIVGGSAVWDWIKATGVGAVNSNGVDVARLGATNMYYDTRINTVAGDPTREHVISFDPQMLKFVSFSRNAGIFATDIQSLDLERIYQTGGTDYVHGAFVDPMTGLIWDLNINYDKCNFRWTFYLQLEWDILFMPPMVCNIQGINGIFAWTTCPVPVYNCDEYSALTPVNTSTFAYDTSGEITFPMYIAKLTIGGQTTMPGADVANVAALAAMFNANHNGITFSAVGTELRYTGYAGISFTINEGLSSEVEGTFTI